MLGNLSRKVRGFSGKIDRCAVAGSGGATLRGVLNMAAMKPRTGDGPLEATAEGRSIVVRIPTEGGGRLVIEMSPQEAQDLAEVLTSAI